MINKIYTINKLNINKILVHNIKYRNIKKKQFIRPVYNLLYVWKVHKVLNFGPNECDPQKGSAFYIILPSFCFS